MRKRDETLGRAAVWLTARLGEVELDALYKGPADNGGFFVFRRALLALLMGGLLLSATPDTALADRDDRREHHDRKFRHHDGDDDKRHRFRRDFDDDRSFRFHRRFDDDRFRFEHRRFVFVDRPYYFSCSYGYRYHSFYGYPGCGYPFLSRYHRISHHPCAFRFCYGRHHFDRDDD